MRRSVPLAIVVPALVMSACFPAEWGAGAILHPSRTITTAVPTLPHRDLTFESEGLRLRGWLFPASGPRRGLIVYLHGIADNRGSALGIAQRYVPRGFDVLAYDSRGHGDSAGDTCTYGTHERKDLSRALDAIGASSAIAFGVSLGAAVALEAAAEDPRIKAVVALAPFSDLRSVVTDRAPWIATRADIERSLALAGQRGGFAVDDASPADAAGRIHVPVLLIHGEADDQTPPTHSQRIFVRLQGPRRLLLVPGANHDNLLARDDTWQAIDDWIEAAAR